MPVLTSIAVGGALAAVCTAAWKRSRREPGAPVNRPGDTRAAAMLDAAERVRRSAGATWRRLSGEARAEQMNDLSADAGVEAGDEPVDAHRTQIDRAFKIASANLAIGAASIAYPPVLIVTVPGFLYSAAPVLALAKKTLVEERRVSAYLLDGVLTAGVLAGGYMRVGVLGVWIMLLGRKILLASEDRSKRNLRGLLGGEIRTAWMVRSDGSTVEVSVERLESGDRVAVRAGQVIPVDGYVTWGDASVDQHRLTGESTPVERSVGDPVIAATTVLTGELHIEVERAGEAIMAARILRILEETEDYKSSVQASGERLADQAALPMLALSAATLPFLGLSPALAVLSNTFGFKMRLFSPANAMAHLGVLCEHGVLVKDGRSLELLPAVDMVVFDKTGTLTVEQPTPAEIWTWHDVDEETLIRYTAAAEQGQVHPIARALVDLAGAQPLPQACEAAYSVGFGIEVRFADRRVRVGSRRFMTRLGVELPSTLDDVQEAVEQRGASLVLVAFDERVVGAIELQATVRPEARALVDDLKGRGLEIGLLSGDRFAPSRTLADALGIQRVFAEVLPEQKAEIIDSLQEEGRRVCFVGDGINDALALTRSSVSISMRGATTLATDTAQIVMMDGTLKNLPLLFDLVDDFDERQRRNLWVSTVPSVLCIGGVWLFHWGVGTGILITGGSLLTGLANSLRVLYTQLPDEAVIAQPGKPGREEDE